ncbi:MAG: HAD family hydrolase [Desulfomonile tiedjei]|nr:HAD family hydrolase [Desulfomonile tiedjei]
MDYPEVSTGSCAAIFLDRDGVINVKLPENHYVSGPSQFELIPGAVEALAILKKLEYLLVVITNQRGIARGFMTEEDLARVHDHMAEVLFRNGIAVDRVYHCPHDEGDPSCDCRKPKPGMILRAVEELDCDVSRSYMVGDSPADVEAGRNAGVRAVRITEEEDGNAHLVFRSLLDFAVYLERITAASGEGHSAESGDR